MSEASLSLPVIRPLARKGAAKRRWPAGFRSFGGARGFGWNDMASGRFAPEPAESIER